MHADARVPGDFYGVVAQGPVLPGDYELMAGGGVEVLRFPIEWAQVERQPGVYDWARHRRDRSGRCGARDRPAAVRLVDVRHG